MDIFAKCYDTSTLDEVRAKGIYPYFHALESRQATEVIMENKRRIMLGSNNYLGLTSHPEVIEAGVRAYEEYGSGCSGSRFLNGTLKLHLQLEEELAEFLRKESVMTFSTGFQSNLGIISAIAGRNDYIIMDRENHASLYDACRLSLGKMLRFRHNDMADLERKLNRVPENAGCLIVTDGVFSMGGDIANLPEICRLAKQHNARVMVDDAHGLGVIGEGGRGTASYYGLEDDVDKEAFVDKLQQSYGGGSGACQQNNADDFEARIQAIADKKMDILLNQYGVTDVDYTIRIGDKIISGNSKKHMIKNVTNWDGMVNVQMASIAESVKLMSIFAVILVAIVVTVILGIITSSNVKRQRQSLGIMKGLGYSSKDLMTQMALKIMPVTIVSVIISGFLGIVVNKIFWMSGFGSIAKTNVPVLIVMEILLVAFCYIVTYISAGKVKKISVTELMTE